MNDLLTDLGHVEQTRRRMRLLRCNMLRLHRDKPKNFCERARGKGTPPSDRSHLETYLLNHLPKLGDARPVQVCQTRANRRENDNVTADFSFEDGGYLIEVYASEVQPGQWKVHSVSSA